MSKTPMDMHPMVGTWKFVVGRCQGELQRRVTEADLSSSFFQEVWSSRLNSRHLFQGLMGQVMIGDLSK